MKNLLSLSLVLFLAGCASNSSKIKELEERVTCLEDQYQMEAAGIEHEFVYEQAERNLARREAEFRARQDHALKAMDESVNSWVKQTNRAVKEVQESIYGPDKSKMSKK